ARSSASQNQQRPIAVLHCFPLGRVELCLPSRFHPHASSVPCALHTQVLVLPLPQQGLERGQFGVGVDTQNLLGIGHGDMCHTVVLGHRDRDDIREVLLALSVMPTNASQGWEEKGPP